MLGISPQIVRRKCSRFEYNVAVQYEKKYDF